MLLAKLIQFEDRRESMVSLFLTSTVKRPLVMDLAAELTYFQASWSILKSPCLIRRIIEATESSELVLLLESDFECEPRKGERPLSIVY